MVSLRFGSTTDNKDASDPPEVSSKRKSRRLATNKDSRLGEKESSAKIRQAKGATKDWQIPLAPIQETPQSEEQTGVRSYCFFFCLLLFSL